MGKKIIFKVAEILTACAILILILINFGCSSSKYLLSENDDFISIFTKEELMDLQILFDFFNQKISSDCDYRDLDKCYYTYLERNSTAYETGFTEFNIPIAEQLDIYSRISDSTFHTIWCFGWAVYQDYPQDTFKHITYNPDGKYFKLLKRIGENDEIVEDYYKTIELVGDIAPSNIIEFVANYRAFNFGDLRIKFFIAIHYLTLNDQNERKEKHKE
ncbi:MAG: hypothetical protein LBQ60_21450 [Bacteroidales bacterium]|jgi:hypothetical protein|nr:hypothetical protein [Bacteroidales bacterium]